MKTYTAGFIFNEDLSRVVLARKNRPDWQKGKLNGPGGKIEAGETSVECMVREILEETGFKTRENDWHYFARIKGQDWWVDFYAQVYKGDASAIRSLTDEEISWFSTQPLPENVIDYLNWFITMGIDKLLNNNFMPCEVDYK